MAFKNSTLARVLENGLRYAARTAAMHEGMPWSGEARVPSMGLIRGIEAGASGGLHGKRPRHHCAEAC
jgi:hypothetical protein